MLGVLNLYWCFNWAFCNVTIFLFFAVFSLYSLGYNGVYCITGQSCCCVNDGAYG